MYGDIPYERFIVHKWRDKLKKPGTIPGEFVVEVSEGLVDISINQARV